VIDIGQVSRLTGTVGAAESGNSDEPTSNAVAKAICANLTSAFIPSSFGVLRTKPPFVL
jgi:hypothetical protein